LIQIVDAAMAEAARRSGSWLLCRPGCSQCCMGTFAITQLDARRLRAGLASLAAGDPERAARILARAALGPPGDDDACPVLDPETGTCDLYTARPITCRTFGPPVRCGEEAMGVCELCYEGATVEEIAACEVDIDPDDMESDLLQEFGAAETTVTGALLELPASN
jgi:Fe-S-cluster containining protein